MLAGGDIQAHRRKGKVSLWGFARPEGAAVAGLGHHRAYCRGGVSALTIEAKVNVNLYWSDNITAKPRVCHRCGLEIRSLSYFIFNGYEVVCPMCAARQGRDTAEPSSEMKRPDLCCPARWFWRKTG